MNADDQSRGTITKSFNATSVSTLRQTKDILEQKLTALKAGAVMHQRSADDVQKLDELETAIATAREKINDQEVEISKHERGPALGLNNAGLEILREALALLLQRKATLKYAALY
jgi:hypothetical protein